MVESSDSIVKELEASTLLVQTMRAHAVPKSATKNPNGSSTKIQLHVAHSSEIPSEAKHKVIDFSEKKLQRLLKSLYSAEKRSQVADLLQKYIAGNAAVGWSAGSPIFIDIAKDK